MGGSEMGVLTMSNVTVNVHCNPNPKLHLGLIPRISSKKQKRVIIALLNPFSDASMHILLHSPAYTSSRWLQGLLGLPKQTMRQLSFTTSNLVQNI